MSSQQVQPIALQIVRIISLLLTAQPSREPTITENDGTGDDDGLSDGAIAGIIIAVIFAAIILAVIIVIAIVLLRRRRSTFKWNDG